MAEEGYEHLKKNIETAEADYQEGFKKEQRKKASALYKKIIKNPGMTRPHMPYNEAIAVAIGYVKVAEKSKLQQEIPLNEALRCLSYASLSLEEGDYSNSVREKGYKKIIRHDLETGDKAKKMGITPYMPENALYLAKEVMKKLEKLNKK